MVIPATHTKADMEDRPLPELRSEVVLFVWVWDKGVVGGHHGHVKVYEIAEKWGFI